MLTLLYSADFLVAFAGKNKAAREKGRGFNLCSLVVRPLSLNSPKKVLEIVNYLLRRFCCLLDEISQQAYAKK